MTKNNHQKKVFIVTLLFALILISLSVFVSFAYMAVSTTGFATNPTVKNTTACLDVNYSESGTINLNYQYPISDAYALANVVPVTITVTNTCTSGDAINYVLAFTSLSKNHVNASDPYYIPDNKMRIQVKRSLNGASQTVLESADYLSTLLTVSGTNTINYINNALSQRSDTSGFTNKTHYLVDSNTIGYGMTNTYYLYLWIDYYEGDSAVYSSGAVHNSSYDNTTEGYDFKGAVNLVVNTDLEIYRYSNTNYNSNQYSSNVSLVNAGYLYYKKVDTSVNRNYVCGVFSGTEICLGQYLENINAQFAALGITCTTSGTWVTCQNSAISCAYTTSASEIRRCTDRSTGKKCEQYSNTEGSCS